MNDNSIEKFTFKDVEDDMLLTVANFVEGDVVKFRTNAEGDIIRRSEQTIKDTDGSQKVIKYILGFIIKDGINCGMKINNKSLINIRLACKGNLDDLVNKSFTASIEGNNEFKHIVLRQVV